MTSVLLPVLFLVYDSLRSRVTLQQKSLPYAIKFSSYNAAIRNDA